MPKLDSRTSPLLVVAASFAAPSRSSAPSPIGPSPWSRLVLPPELEAVEDAEDVDFGSAGSTAESDSSPRPAKPPEPQPGAPSTPSTTSPPLLTAQSVPSGPPFPYGPPYYHPYALQSYGPPYGPSYGQSYGAPYPPPYQAPYSYGPPVYWTPQYAQAPRPFVPPGYPFGPLPPAQSPPPALDTDKPT